MVEQAELLEHDFVALQALGALVFVEFFFEIAFDGGAGGELALDGALDGQAGFVGGELDELIDQREELLGLLGRDVGGGFGVWTDSAGWSLGPEGLPRRRAERAELAGARGAVCCAAAAAAAARQSTRARASASAASDLCRLVMLALLIHSPCGILRCAFRSSGAWIPASHFKAIIRMRFCAKFQRENPAPNRGKVPMPETDLAANLQATALAAMLESARTPHELAAYRGALTPRELDAPEAETAALAAGAALHDLGWMRRVAVRGADRFRWLSGMVTNTVNDLFPNTGAWNLVLNAQGHIQGDLTVWRGGEELSPQRRSRVRATERRGRRPACWERRLPANRGWSWRLRPTRSTSCWPI